MLLCVLFEVLGKDTMELVKPVVLGGKKTTNQITSQINVILNCVKCNKGEIARGVRADKSGIRGEFSCGSHISSKP